MILSQLIKTQTIQEKNINRLGSIELGVNVDLLTSNSCHFSIGDISYSQYSWEALVNTKNACPTTQEDAMKYFKQLEENKVKVAEVCKHLKEVIWK